MSRYRFLLSRRWVAMALVAVLVASVCIMLGRWQWNRHETRAAANELVTSNYDAAPVALETLVGQPGSVPPEEVWRPVELSGRWAGEQVVLRNRPVEGSDSVRVLSVLRVAEGVGEADTAEDGALVVVDRGWLPEDDLADVPSPQGERALVGRLRVAEGGDERVAPVGQVFSIDPPAVLAAAGVAEDAPVLDGYVIADAVDEAGGDAPLQPFPRPETDPGPHLSYAFQWWVFAAGALGGVGYLARREASETAPVRRRSSDAEVEDSILDAQLGSDAARSQARETSSA